MSHADVGGLSLDNDVFVSPAPAPAVTPFLEAPTLP
jgi:hypothetical protein